MVGTRSNKNLHIDDLRKANMLHALEAGILERLRGECHGMWFSKGAEIISHLDDSDDVYFLLEGMVRADSYTQSGRHVTYELIEPGGMFGELAAIDGLPRSASVAAETDVLVARLSATGFRTLVRSSPDAAWSAFERLVRLTRWLSGRLFENYALSSRGRLYTELLRLCDRTQAGEAPPIVIRDSPTDGDIASRINATRELVNRRMAELRNLGIVERDVDRTQLVIYKVDALRELLEDEEAG